MFRPFPTAVEGESAQDDQRLSLEASKASSQSANSYYRPELDVVRMLAFLSVFGHHTTARDPAKHLGIVIAIADSLGFGLCLFFTLSAYLITLLLIREKEQKGSIDLRRFYARRALRIWPLYFLGLTIGIVYASVEGQWHSQEHWYLAALFMCGNLVAFSGPLVGHLWSISLEEQFYVFFPSALRYTSRKSIVIIAIAFIVLANITLIHFGRIHAETESRVWSNTFVQFEMFAAGVLLAVFDRRRKTFSRAISATMLMAVPFVWLVVVMIFHIKGHSASPVGPASLCAGYGIVAICCVIVLVAAPGIQRWPPVCIYLGKVSYGLYVFHIPILLIAHRYWEPYLPHLLIGPICLALTIVCAAFSYKYFESPFLYAKRRLEVVHSRPV